MQDIDLNKATQPYEYYMKYIKENRRPDGRRLSEIRPCSVRLDCIQNTVHGSATVKLGSTTVICGIQGRLFTPKVDRPDRGCLVPNVELPALCSPKNFASSSGQSSGGGASGGGSSSKGGQSVGPQSIEQTQSMLSHLMLDVLNESGCVNERALCIAPFRLAWALYIDLICLNHDGNVQDACVLAMISALKTIKLPEVNWIVDESAGELNDDSGQIKVTFPLKMIPLKLQCEPVCTTMFAIADDHGVILLSDPNKQEEEFARTFLIVCTVSDEKISLMRKLGAGLGLNQEQMDLCISRSLENGIHIRKNVFNSS